MIRRIVLNDLNLEVGNFQEQETINEVTGNRLRKIKFDSFVIGKTDTDKLNDIMGSKGFDVKLIGDEEIKFRGKKGGTYNTSYRDQLNENTQVLCTIEIEELDKDLPEDHEAFGAQFSTVIMNWVRTRALSELLVDKGIITMDEYQNKIKELHDRDYQNLAKFVMFGIPEKKDDN